jgi:hypothetical protein
LFHHVFDATVKIVLADLGFEAGGELAAADVQLEGFRGHEMSGKEVGSEKE